MTTVNVRYIVRDVEEAIAFYTEHLGFGGADASRSWLCSPCPRRFAPALERRWWIRRGGPGDARWPSPGAWRLEPYPDRGPHNLPALVEQLRSGGAHFRNDIVSGNGETDSTG